MHGYRGTRTEQSHERREEVGVFVRPVKAGYGGEGEGLKISSTRTEDSGEWIAHAGHAYLALWIGEAREDYRSDLSFDLEL
jgi:hypothetical protein